MIKANELRVGNLMRDVSGTNKIMYVSGITTVPNGYEKIFYRPLGSKINSEIFTIEIVPIPLTEEILLKCGFEKSKDGFDFYKDLFNDCFLFLDKDNGYNVLVKQYNMDGTLDQILFKEIKSLHQLQNLYFALTGEELNILI